MNNSYTHRMHLVKKKKKNEANTKYRKELSKHPSVVDGIGVPLATLALYFALIANSVYLFKCG